MKKSASGGGVIELPRMRERALERAFGLLQDDTIPMDQMWALCRVLENMRQMQGGDIQTLESITELMLQGAQVVVQHGR